MSELKEVSHLYQGEYKTRKTSALTPEAEAAIDHILERTGAAKSCCPLSEPAKEAAPVLFGKYKDVGNGDIERGINIREDDARYWSTMRKVYGKIFDIVLKWLIPAGFTILGINKLLEILGKK